MEELSEIFQKIGPLLSGAGVAGLLAAFWYLEYRERTRIQKLREAEDQAKIERLYKALHDSNIGMGETRDSLVTISTVLASIRDLIVVTGRIPIIPPPPKRNGDNEDR